MNREQRAILRLLQLNLWAQSRGADGFTFADVKEQFPDVYRGSDQADRQWTRDKTQLRRMGLRLRRFGQGHYAVDSAASRARNLRLSAAEVAVLDDVAAFLPSIAFSDAAHHVESALRKLALSGVELHSGAQGRADAARAAWAATNARVPTLPRSFQLQPVVDIVYADPETGQETRDRVEIEHVYLGNKVIVGTVEGAEEPRTFLAAFVRSMRPVGGDLGDGWGSRGYQMSGYASIVDGFGDELTRKANVAFGLAPRPNVTSMQRALGVGYLLLNAMVAACPRRIPWAEAMRLSGARDRRELDRVIEVLQEMTLPGLGEGIENLALDKGSDGIGLYMHHQGIPKLALRPVEVGLLCSAARAASGNVPSVESLSRKLRGVLDEKEQPYALKMADTFDFGAAP